MGYRNYLSVVSKADYEKYHNMIFDELKQNLGSDDSDFIDICKIESYIEIKEISLYSSVKDLLDKHTTEFFTNYKDLDCTSFATDGKPFLEALIEVYRKDVLLWYERLNKEVMDGKTDRLISNFRIDYTVMSNTKEISDSKYLLMDVYSKEDSIFNLVYLLKTFDFENEVLIYRGY